MSDPADERAEFDLRLQDPAALAEIELYSELIILAGASSQSLTAAEIDRALGVHTGQLPQPHQADAASPLSAR
jgi:hypothetical protein